MTGYGRGTVTHKDFEIAVELSAVNRKTLEVTTAQPREWQSLERNLTEKVRGSVNRGKVHVTVQIKRQQTAGGLNWDTATVAENLQRLQQLAKTLDLRFEPDAHFLLRLVASSGDSAQLPEGGELWPLLEQALDEALGQLLAMRTAEGQALGKDISTRLERLAGWVGEIHTLTESTVPTYRELLLQRLQKAKLEVDLNDERVLKEIALFADRADTTEEITRLGSHIEQFQEALDAEGAIGRKLDFICQEINRELNTIGSKANKLDITRLVIECKNELERIREQVQNIE